MSTKSAASQKTSELLDQAARTYFDAMRNGLKIQEDVAARWMKLFGKGDGDTIPRAVQQSVRETVPLAQKQAEEALKIIEKGTRQSLDLIGQAFEAGEAGSATEAQARLEKLWESSLNAMRDNAEALVQANARVMESWASIARKNVERATPSAKAA